MNVTEDVTVDVTVDVTDIDDNDECLKMLIFPPIHLPEKGESAALSILPDVETRQNSTLQLLGDYQTLVLGVITNSLCGSKSLPNTSLLYKTSDSV